MATVDRWPVEISLREDDSRTTAEARLAHGDTGMTGHGLARRNPSDAEVAEIGEEIAAARALADLAYQLLGDATQRIEAITHRRAHLNL